MIIKYIIYIIIYIQTVYTNTYNITINSDNISEEYIYKYNDNAISKGSISSTSYGWNYYCRNGDCIMLENGNSKPYIEFPDEKGNIKKYIFRSCEYDSKLKNNEYCAKRRTFNYPENITDVYVTCNSDSECFFNKCIDNYCVFNEDSGIEHCDIIYKYFAVFEFSHIHCGKTYMQSCSNDKECSTERCYEDEGLCSSSVEVPNESTSFGRNMETVFCFAIFFVIFVIISFICFIYRCCKNKYKKIDK
ncbi:hypothetical protein BCR32DRAFT_242284 [Anaeromyces robustus]|uniref:Uncharacterized protein n=1 Tax=Anaeromyces robustus TaxID=1754192 RepID=A0A1Y1XGL6_9FUNG|nr:hypothetical protein BCR32DRAFT_242284 [Anaeromyces robustus]|eukprot:ORX84832.1 hypothetical protein BCR32DRAFT_242284 [Anaeromyces robustus]